MDKPVTPIKTSIKMIQYAAGYEYTREAYCDERFVFEPVSHIEGETTAFSSAYYNNPIFHDDNISLNSITIRL